MKDQNTNSVENPIIEEEQVLSPETQDAVDQGEADMQALLQAAKEEAARNLDLALRVKADMENLRRRAEKDVQAAQKFALEKFVNALIPVLDSLDMGLDAAKQAGVSDEASQKILEGMEMTLKQFIDVFADFNVERLDPLGETFDPNMHEALTMQPAAEGVAKNTVTLVIQKGYALNGRVVRPARVIVAQ